jgi:hypothetical protein
MTPRHANRGPDGMIPLRIIPGQKANLALVPDFALSRAYARELEARERAEAMRQARPMIRKALDALVPVIMAKLGRA